MTTEACAQEPKFGVVAPTYDNAATLPAVLESLDALGLPVVAVDDGSTDSTAAVLAGWCGQGDANRFVRTHPVNRGKAAALRTGFDALRELGCTHAVTIDTDGQLNVSDIPELMRASESSPAAMVVGSRDMGAADYPTKSRVGRVVSNRLVRLVSGAAVSDSQCGLRVYPLGIVSELGARTERYAFETECLVRAAWAGVPILEAPVSCRYEIDGGRVTHFRAWFDSLRSAGMHARLLARAHWPVGPRRLGDCEATGTIVRRFARWISPVRAWRSVRAEGTGRRRFAAGLAVGVFIANLPIYGIQTVTAMLAAKWLRLHPISVVAGAHVSTPPIGPVLITAAIAVGHRLLRGGWPALSAYSDRPIAEVAGALILEWVVGGVLIGAVLAAVTFFVSWAALSPLRERGDPTRRDQPDIAASSSDASVSMRA